MLLDITDTRLVVLFCNFENTQLLSNQNCVDDQLYM